MFKKFELNTIIKNEIKNINKYFLKNELAYLALTSKIEFPIRDKFAFKLHTKLFSQNLMISREWKRADIGIIKNKKPIAIFEFKAMYTFDGTKIKKNVNNYPELMINDLLKIQKLAIDDTKLYSILFATHPLKKIDKNLNEIVKYDKGINNAFNKHKTAEKILKTCDTNIENFFKNKNLKITKGSIDAGECFQTKIKIPFWIIGPFNKNDKLS